MQSELSYEDYAAWCKSRSPALDPDGGPVSRAATQSPGSDECPVTVRSAQGVVVSTSVKGSV